MIEHVPSMVVGVLGGGLRLLVTLGLVGLAVTRWQRHPRASMFAVTAAVMGLVSQGLGLVLPRVVGSEGLALVMLGLQVFGVVGYGLLAAAVFVDRPGDATAEPRSRW